MGNCGCNNKKKASRTAANFIVTLPSGRQKSYVHQSAAEQEARRTGGTVAPATPVAA